MKFGVDRHEETFKSNKIARVRRASESVRSLSIICSRVTTLRSCYIRMQAFRNVIFVKYIFDNGAGNE